MDDYVTLGEDLPMYPNERYDLRCGDCGATMVLRKSLKYPRPFYGCSQFPECKGTHGAKSDGSPLGIPADQRTKKARIKAHEVFDKIWKQKLVDRGKSRLKTKGNYRSQAYRWMQRAMRLSRSQAHISLFTYDQCQELMKLVYRDFPQLHDRYSRLLYSDSDEDQLII